MGVTTQNYKINHILAMTKKDYILISSVLRSVFNENAFCLDSNQDKYSVAERFAIALSNTNPLFNKEKFLTACGVEKSEEEDNLD